ncbi:MAG: integrase [Candidatus Poriferisodalaceae bacterium]|jgi:integrase
MSVLEAAVHNRKIAHSPAVKIKLPTINKNVANSIIALGLDDVRRIADAAPRWMTAFVWTVAPAGRRPGEAAGLTLEHVDFMRREIHVDRKLTTIARYVDETPEGETRTTAVLAHCCVD